MPHKPVIDEKIKVEFSVDSVQVMQSILKPTGPEYVVLEDVELK